jgi:hypothetical protein
MFTRIFERMPDENVAAEPDPDADVSDDPEVIEDLVHLKVFFLFKNFHLLVPMVGLKPLILG